jgi:metalloendopeptidase OMA1, mitochondrial
MKIAFQKCVLPSLLLLMSVGCTTVSETGRRQLILLSPQQEMQLGFSSFETMKSSVPISQDPVGNALIKKVGERIASVALLPNAQWEFVLFDSPEANAFCLPGGKVGVYTGLLAITEDESGLATVIGHEVAHAEKRHGNERVSRAMVTQLGGNLLQSGMSAHGYDNKTQVAAATVYGLTSSLGVSLPHSRAQESEADYIGLIRMAQAGYDPSASVAFWKRFAAYNQESGSGGVPWFLRTHPLDSKRIEDLERWIPEASHSFRAFPK